MKLFIIILTLVMTFKPVLPLVDYAINYDYISEVLCINKDKPELECNGKCHLKTELAKASDENSNQDENQNNSPKIEQIEFVDDFDYNLSLTQNNFETVQNISVFNQNYHFLFSDSVFHPPLA